MAELKKFRIVYWFGSIMTEKYLSAKSIEEVKRVFIDITGYSNQDIINIEECY